MFFRMILFVWEFVLDVAAVKRMTKDEKDLEIMLLRQPLRMVERNQPRGPWIPRWQKVPLAVLAVAAWDTPRPGTASPGKLMACDFFTVETLGLQTLYGLFFLEHGTRRVHLARCTAHPSGNWVTQQARQVMGEFEDRELPIRYLIHDHDTRFTDAFDTVFEAESVEIVDIPYHAPNANAYADRWGLRSARSAWIS